MFSFSTQFLAYFCRLWFQWQFTFQNLCGAILSGLINMVLMGPSLVPAGDAWGSRRCFTRLGCLMSLGGGGESLVFKNSTLPGFAYSGGNSPTPCQCCMPGISFGERGILKIIRTKGFLSQTACCNRISPWWCPVCTVSFGGPGESLAWWETKALLLTAYCQWGSLLHFLAGVAMLTYYCQQDSHSTRGAYLSNHLLLGWELGNTGPMLPSVGW